jgi:hypothetical protein
MKPLDLITEDTFDLEDRQVGKAKKRLFVGLVVGAGAGVVAFLFTTLILPLVGLKSLHPWAPYIFTIGVLGLALVVIWATLGLVLNIMFGHSLLFFSKIRGLTIKLYLPLVVLVGKSLGISKDRVRSSFVKVNNDLVSISAKKYRPEELLMLMPHCLQNSRCKMRLTYSMDNCKRCGLCPIDGLLTVSEKYGIHLAVATGGTIARRIVVQRRPKMIIAVACERDLASGIQDTYPIPVYGVLNARPHGPCLDTTVAMAGLEAAIHKFMDPAFLPGGQDADMQQQESVANAA